MFFARRSQRRHGSLRPSAGGTKRRGQCHERVLSLWKRARQSPHCHTALAKPGSGIPANGFIDRRLWTPHAFRGFDLKTHPGTDCSSTSPDEGQALDFRLLLVRSTLAARGMTIDPVRTGRLHRRSTLRLVRPCGFAWRQRQDASNPLLQPTFRVTSTHASTISGDHLPSAVGKPRRLSASGSVSSAAFPPIVRVGRRTTLRSSSLQRSRD